MNVFVTSSDPAISAQNLDDKRLIKQTLEVGQILSTALYNLGYWKANLYWPVHEAHPCVMWAGDSRGNFNWLTLYGLALGVEYKYRFGKGDHKTTSVILSCAEAFKECRLDSFGMTPWKNCTDVIGTIPVTTKYQIFLSRKYDGSTPKWTRRGSPEWYPVKEKVNGR